jgi:hypothetical protein
MCGWNQQAVARGQRPGSAGEDRPGRITGKRFRRYLAERISYQSTGLRLRSSARRPVAFCSGSAMAGLGRASSGDQSDGHAVATIRVRVVGLDDVDRWLQAALA